LTKPKTRFIAVFVGLLLMVATGYGQTEEFEQANRFYQDKDYESAIRLYQAVLDQGLESANVYFNLGNACFKSGDLGHAVLYYHKARRLAPDDRDIIDNLEFARQFSRIQMEGVTLNPVNSFFADLVDPYHLDTLAWISSALFVLLMGVLSFRYGFGLTTAWSRVLVTMLVTLLVVSAGLTTFKYRHDYLTRRAVIIAEECMVRTGPSEQSDVELEGAPGLVVQILSERSDFYHVLFENKRRGWVKKDLLAEI